jgi:hypothetical protein
MNLLTEREYNIAACPPVLRLHCRSDTLLFFSLERSCDTSLALAAKFVFVSNSSAQKLDRKLGKVQSFTCRFPLRFGIWQLGQAALPNPETFLLNLDLANGRSANPQIG